MISPLIVCLVQSRRAVGNAVGMLNAHFEPHFLRDPKMLGIVVM
jgi:hypothetical protein